MLELKSHTLQIDARSSDIVRGGGEGCERQIIMLKHIKDGLTF